nr:AAA family ATPase [Mycobacterium sp. GA-1199]
MSRVSLYNYRSVESVEFDVGPFTVLFGKNDVGKTNILEAIYGTLAPQNMPGHAIGPPVRGIRGADYFLPPLGAVLFDLEQGVPFDDSVLAKSPAQADVDANGGAAEPNLPIQVWFFSHSEKAGLLFGDLARYYLELAADMRNRLEKKIFEVKFDTFHIEGPRPRPLFLGWQFDDVNGWATSALADLTAVSDGENIKTQWLEPMDYDESLGLWEVSPEIRQRVNQLGSLATDLLPNFIDGSIEAEFDVPTRWESSPGVSLWFRPRGEEDRHALESFGRGSSRWMSIAVQLALWLMEESQEITGLGFPTVEPFSGNVIFVDEPEAHLHPSAVASVVRWCQRMVSCGFTVVAASHHEEFLRASGDGVTFVKISRDIESSSTQARTVLSTATPLLQELATEVGMHPATVLSLRRAILFVEGPLDEAVLDEYASPALDAAGVLIIPIHGTKNLEGLIDGEFPSRLGVKLGVLTDATVTQTIWERSNRKRSSEEVKLVRLIKRFEDKGLPPPKLFGVPEEDLLFALPAAAIRDYVRGPFPGWHELVDECRTATGKGPSDSVDWKAYAEEHYGLPITTADGVRSVVHELDLAGVELPSIRAVVDEVINWSKEPHDAD